MSWDWSWHMAEQDDRHERERRTWLAERSALVAAGYDLWDWVEAVAEDNYWRGEDEELVGRALDQWRALADPQTANEDAEAHPSAGQHVLLPPSKP